MAQFKGVHEIVLPSFNKELHKEAIVVEGEGVMTLRSEEQGTHKLFGNPSKVRKTHGGHPVLEEDWVMLCQALFQSIKQEE